VREIVQILQERVIAGANTFIVKVKAQRGEPLSGAATQEQNAAGQHKTQKFTPKFLLEGCGRRKPLFLYFLECSQRQDVGVESRCFCIAEGEAVSRQSYDEHKPDESQRYTPSMCHLDRAMREKNEGRGEKKDGSVRTDEVEKRYERPSGEI